MPSLGVYRNFPKGRKRSQAVSTPCIMLPCRNLTTFPCMQEEHRRHVSPQPSTAVPGGQVPPFPSAAIAIAQPLQGPQHPTPEHALFSNSSTLRETQPLHQPSQPTQHFVEYVDVSPQPIQGSPLGAQPMQPFQQSSPPTPHFTPSFPPTSKPIEHPKLPCEPHETNLHFKPPGLSERHPAMEPVAMYNQANSQLGGASPPDAFVSIYKPPGHTPEHLLQASMPIAQAVRFTAPGAASTSDPAESNELLPYRKPDTIPLPWPIIAASPNAASASSTHPHPSYLSTGGQAASNVSQSSCVQDPPHTVPDVPLAGVQPSYPSPAAIDQDPLRAPGSEGGPYRTSEWGTLAAASHAGSAIPHAIQQPFETLPGAAMQPSFALMELQSEATQPPVTCHPPPPPSQPHQPADTSLPQPSVSTLPTVETALFDAAVASHMASPMAMPTLPSLPLQQLPLNVAAAQPLLTPKAAVKAEAGVVKAEAGVSSPEETVSVCASHLPDASGALSDTVKDVTAAAEKSSGSKEGAAYGEGPANRARRKGKGKGRVGEDAGDDSSGGSRTTRQSRRSRGSKSSSRRTDSHRRLLSGANPADAQELGPPVFSIEPPEPEPRTAAESTPPSEAAAHSASFPTSPPPPPLTDNAAGTVAGDCALALKVHGMDRLEPDPILCHPFVRVHVLDGRTGLPLRALSAEQKARYQEALQSLAVGEAPPPLPSAPQVDEAALEPREGDAASGATSGNENGPVLPNIAAGGTFERLVELPESPRGSTAPALVSKPYDIRKQHKYRPQWEEEFALPFSVHEWWPPERAATGAGAPQAAPVERAPGTNALLLFEVLEADAPDLPLGRRIFTRDGLKPIAWAFLTLTGPAGVAPLGRRLRLQLYRYPQDKPCWLGLLGVLAGCCWPRSYAADRARYRTYAEALWRTRSEALKSSDGTEPPLTVPPVYLLFLDRRNRVAANRYHASLYCSLLPRSLTTALQCLPPRLSQMDLLAVPGPAPAEPTEGSVHDVEEATRPEKVSRAPRLDCRRLPGERCLLPDQLMKQLPAGSKV